MLSNEVALAMTQNDLHELFVEAGLLQFTAQDLAESIATNESLAKRLRMLAGDAVLLHHQISQDGGLRDDQT